jgi:hypothetical protein
MKSKYINTRNNFSGDEKSVITRRKFIYSCSACAACMVTPMVFPGKVGPLVAEAGKMRIRVLYSLHSIVQQQPDWPNTGFDFAPVMEKINRALNARFKDIEFIPALATGQADAEKIVALDKQDPVAGYIVYQMNCWNKVVQTIALTGRPVLYVDFQFGGSGGFLVYNSTFLNSNATNVGFVASSRIEDLLAAVDCFRIAGKGGNPGDFAAATRKKRLELTPVPASYNPVADNMKTLSAEESIYRFKNSKILAVRDQTASVAAPLLGIPLEYIPFSEINTAWSEANKDEANSVAERWQKTATEVVNIPFETLRTSAAMYLGMKSVLKAHNANAITINCLGGFYGGHIHAYPCLGFHELCNEGLVGGCECDVRSAATMTAFSIMTEGRPGFISDPVIDTAKRQIIYAHCVASNKPFGPNGPANPFAIMTHSEDRQGASLRSILPVNYLTTTLEINNDTKEILFHQAVAVGNDPDDRACRTKLCAEPKGDIEKLFSMWDKWGWHRVTFYGDLKNVVYSLADATGWKVIEEA